MSAIPDSSDRDISFSRNARNLHGWSVDEWIEAIKRQPERTLPNGVGKALVSYYEAELELERRKDHAHNAWTAGYGAAIDDYLAGRTANWPERTAL